MQNNKSKIDRKMRETEKEREREVIDSHTYTHINTVCFLRIYTLFLAQKHHNNHLLITFSFLQISLHSSNHQMQLQR